MNQEAHALWLRAVRSYKSAAKLADEDPDAAVVHSMSCALDAAALVRLSWHMHRVMAPM
jgi:hypothetical protein